MILQYHWTIKAGCPVNFEPFKYDTTLIGWLRITAKKVDAHRNFHFFTYPSDSHMLNNSWLVLCCCDNKQVTVYTSRQYSIPSGSSNRYFFIGEGRTSCATPL